MRAPRFLAIATAIACALPAGLAHAVKVAVPHAAPKPPKDFWASVIDPHADELRVLLAKADAALAQVDRSRGNDLDATALANRVRLYRELTDLLVYARHLSPTDQDVLERLGRTADEAGNAPLAIDALTTFYKLHPLPQTAARLSAIYLRSNDLDAAIKWGRTAVAAGFTFDRESIVASIYLSTALAIRGDMPAAIDTLQSGGALDRQPEIAQLALAVQLDRDEQRGAASDTIDHLKSTIGEGWAESLEDKLVHFRFAPAEDVHYYRALFDEAIGADGAARTEWLTYAATDGAFAGRALAHVAELDARHRAPRPLPEPLLVPPPGTPPQLHIQHKITP